LSDKLLVASYNARLNLFDEKLVGVFHTLANELEASPTVPLTMIHALVHAMAKRRNELNEVGKKPSTLRWAKKMIFFAQAAVINEAFVDITFEDPVNPLRADIVENIINFTKRNTPVTATWSTPAITCVASAARRSRL
jgi:hypothetical protein